MVSKKACKRFNKAKSGVKTKTKAKHDLQRKINEKESIKDNKRVAKYNEEKKSSTPESIVENQSMDDLLQSDIFGLDDDNEENLMDEILVSDDEIEINNEEETNFQAKDSFESHADELAELEKADPSFFKFLKENDQSLLDFQDLNMDETPKGDDSKVLTMARWELLTKQAFGKNHSFPALRAVIGAYRSAVRSSSDKKGEVKLGKDGKADKKKSSQQEEDKAGMFEIEDEEVFTNVVLNTLDNIIPALNFHLGSIKDKDMKNNGKLDVTKYKKWNTKCKSISRIFVSETLTLLKSTASPIILEQALKTISTCEGQKFIYPFQSMKSLLLKTISHIWALNSNQKVRLFAFWYLRNACSMITSLTEKSLDATKQLEEVMKRVCKSFCDSSKLGYSYRSMNPFRFMENCIIELLALDEKTAYRIGYSFIRQMAIILRNSKIAQGKNIIVNKDTELQNKKQDGKLAKKKAKRDNIKNVLYQWQFIRSIYLWSKCIIKLDFLKPLLFPLVEIIKGSIKTVESQICYFPYIYHLIKNLNNLSINLDCFIPTCDHLLQITQTTIIYMNKISKQRQPSQNTNVKTIAKLQDIEINIRYNNDTLLNVTSIENILKDIDYLFIDSLGIFSRSPSFPEIITPVLLHIKKIVKKCSSSNTRKIFDRLKNSIEISSNEIKILRENIKSIKDITEDTKFLIYDENKISLSKLRLQIIKSKIDDEKLKVESELINKEDELKENKEQKIKDKEEKRTEKLRKREESKNDDNEDDEEDEKPKKKKNRQERIQARLEREQKELEKQRDLKKKYGNKINEVEELSLSDSEDEPLEEVNSDEESEE